jgi:hypothetical protein
MPIDSTISIADFAAEATGTYGCVDHTTPNGRFIGRNGSRSYPHIHVWVRGTIALSVGRRKNTKIGERGEINIDALREAFLRYNLTLGCGLQQTIEWVLASAS